MNFPTLCADKTGKRGRPATLACKANFKKKNLKGPKLLQQKSEGDVTQKRIFFMASHDMIASMLLLSSLDFSRMKIIGVGMLR